MAVSVKLEADIDRRLRLLARELNCSHHYLMCEAIRRFVEEQEARLREHGDLTPAQEDGLRCPADGLVSLKENAHRQSA